MERGFSRAKKVFKEVGRDMRVKPEETDLAVIDEVSSTLLDTRERGTDGGGKDEVAGCGRGKAGLRRK